LCVTASANNKKAKAKIANPTIASVDNANDPIMNNANQ